MSGLVIDYFLADDLSGALDAAAAFHHAGRRVRIVLSSTAWGQEPGDDVIGVTTETRNAEPEKAGAAVLAAMEHAKGISGRLVYKKIDSTLRGPVSAEVEAVARALPDARILFAPANPAVGRTVRGGVLCVHGVPVAETEFGRDPVCPVRRSDVASFVANVPRERVVVPDVIDADGLVAAVNAMRREGGAWVPVGSGALARPVAAMFQSRAGSGAALERGSRLAGGAEGRRGVLMLGGSAHPVNRLQSAVLAERCGGQIRESGATCDEEVVNAVLADVSQRGVGLLVIEQTRGDSAAMLGAFSEVATRIVAASGVRRIFVSGGATAFALCRRLKIESLGFCAELEPGLCVARGHGADGEWLLAVKPGGFGARETWVKAHERLGGESVGG